jgi:phosphoenolpyruvate carboxylase
MNGVQLESLLYPQQRRYRIATPDLSIMHAYADLVADKAMHRHFMELVESEYQRTRRMLEMIYSGALGGTTPQYPSTALIAAAGPSHSASNADRAAAPMARCFRPGKTKPLPQLLWTVNAIASRLWTTG